MRQDDVEKAGDFHQVVGPRAISKKEASNFIFPSFVSCEGMKEDVIFVAK